MERIAQVYAEREPLSALDRLVEIFGNFWASDRVLIRRLRALAMLDAEAEQAVRRRDEWRRGHMQTLLGRLRDRSELQPIGSFDDAVDALHTLTSFETFDTLAGTRRTIEDVIPLVQRLVRSAAGLPDG
jgi:hypothetical protein